MEQYIYPIMAIAFAVFDFIILNRMLSTSYKKSIERPFLVVVLVALVFNFIDAAFGLLNILNTDGSLVIYMQIATYLWHLGIAINSFLWTHYIIVWLGENYARKNLIYAMRIALLATPILVLATNPISRLLFSFDGGTFTIERTRYIYFIFTTVFFLSGVLFTLIQLVQCKSKQEKKQCIAAIFFNLIPLIATALQLVNGSSRVPLYSSAFSITVVILYIFNLNDIKESALHDQYDIESNLRKESLETIRILSSDYTSIYYIDLETQNMTIYRASDDIAEIFGDVLYKQANFAQLFNYYLDQRIQNSDREDIKKFADINYIKNLVRNQDIYTYTYRVGTEDDFRYYQMKLVKVSSGEEVKAVILGIADIDEQVRQEKEYQIQLETAMQAADAASQAKTSFLFNMSHDIRTPMNAIIGFTDLARKHMDDRDKVEDCLGKVRSSSEHLLSLINDVLDMSRIESGKFNIVTQPTDLKVAIDETISMLNVNAKAKNLELTSILDIKHKDLVMDELHVGRVLINIIGNSIKYTPAGGHISLTCSETPSYEDGYATYTFVCKDDGIGMDKHYVDHIFEAFTREETSTVSKIQGTGLGMAITKQLVDKLGGNIEVTSEKGKGTTVTIVFELELCKQAIVKEEEHTAEEIGNILKGKKVLLVEDNELNREIAKAVLEEQGVIIEDAEDGTVAVEKVTANDPTYYDLVLMDIQMPKMNGYDATVAIRNAENEKYKDLIIIAMTANAFAEDKQHALNVGMNGHIAKPIDFDNLLATLAKLLKK